jgi:outer membrane biosynthesis protein TonB
VVRVILARAGFTTEARPAKRDYSRLKARLNAASEQHCASAAKSKPRGWVNEVTRPYPKLAKEARVNGLARMKAVVAKDGTAEHFASHQRAFAAGAGCYRCR